MPIRRLHVSDEELIQTVDRELPVRRTSRVLKHLENCPDCRARLSAIAETSDSYRRAWLQESTAHGSPLEVAKARLRARIAAQQQDATAAAAPTFTHVWTAGAALALAACLAAVVAFVPHRTEKRAAIPELAVVPNPSLTPGATRNVSIAYVCSMPHDQVVAHVPASVRARVLAEYGIQGLYRGDYEIDYLITPGLGGTDDIHNLWPEPYGFDEWNAHVKDALEERLHEMVCDHQIDLQAAQRALAGDWIAAYKKYFHTDRPLPAVSLLTEKPVVLRLNGLILGG